MTLVSEGGLLICEVCSRTFPDLPQRADSVGEFGPEEVYVTFDKEGIAHDSDLVKKMSEDFTVLSHRYRET